MLQLRNGTEGMLRRLALIALTLAAGTSMKVSATTITEQITSLGGNEYRAEFSVTNDALGTAAACTSCGSPGPFTFRLYFEPQLYGHLSVLATPANGGGFIETQPGPGDFDYGRVLFDVFGGLPGGASQGGFSLSFTWIDQLGGVDPAARPQFFEVLDRTTVPFATGTESGFTTVSQIPEPHPYALLAAGLALLVLFRRRSSVYNRA